MPSATPRTTDTSHPHYNAFHSYEGTNSSMSSLEPVAAATVATSPQSWGALSPASTPGLSGDVAPGGPTTFVGPERLPVTQASCMGLQWLQHSSGSRGFPTMYSFNNQRARPLLAAPLLCAGRIGDPSQEAWDVQH